MTWFQLMQDVHQARFDPAYETRKEFDHADVCASEDEEFEVC